MDEDNELEQIQALWGSAKLELAKLRALTKKQANQLVGKDDKLKDLTRLFEQRKMGIENALLEAKGKEEAYKKELDAMMGKLEEERQIRREIEEKCHDLEFEMDNCTAGMQSYKYALEKLQSNHEHILRSYAETKEQNREIQERLEASQRAHAEVLGKIMNFEERVVEMDNERRETRRQLEDMRDREADAIRRAKNAEEDMKRAETRRDDLEKEMNEQIQKKERKAEQMERESKQLLRHANDSRVSVLSLRQELESAAERERAWRKKCRAISTDLSQAKHALKLKGMDMPLEKGGEDWDQVIDIDAFREDFDVRTTQTSRGARAYVNDIDYRESEDLRVSQGYKSKVPRYPGQSASSMHQSNLGRSRYGLSRRHLADERRPGMSSSSASTGQQRFNPGESVQFHAPSNEITAYADVLEDLYPRAAASREEDERSEPGLTERFDEWLRS